MTLTDLYDYYLDKAGHLNRWQRGGTTVVNTVPDAPNITSLSITGGGTATIAWTAPPSDGGSPITGYTVTRVGGATHTLGVVLSDTFTGLTAGVTYTFLVAAINAVGTGPADSASASSTSVSTVWGINNNQGFSWMTIAARQAWFAGRMPVIRTYASPFSSATPTYAPTTPEGRAAWSWKAGGLYSEVQLGDGTATPAMKHWLESIPAGEQVWWAFHHEVNNGNLQPNGTYMEVLPANYLAIYHQMHLARASATLQSGVEVIICCNFMMEAGLSTSSPKWSNAWVPPRSDCDCFTVDLYGNPAPSRGPNKYGGYPDDGTNKTAYDCTYPLVSARMAGAFGIIQACGYADSWGVWEFNSPQKTWDPNETGRIAWHNDYIASVQSPPMTGNVPARIALPWEAPLPPASTWDQRYGRLDLNPNRIVPVLKPLITGTPRRR